MSERRDSDPLAGIDTARIRVEGSIVETLRSLDTVGERTPELDDSRRDAVNQAVHAARHSLTEALRRCSRT